MDTLGKVKQLPKVDKEHSEMMEKALSEPGIAEAMRIYSGWKEEDMTFQEYQRARGYPSACASSDTFRGTEAKTPKL